MEHYFSYGMACGCGIPRVKLLGSLEDWQNLKLRLEGLCQYGCAEWVAALSPVIEKFIAAYEGEVDKDFWDMCGKCYPSNASGMTFDSGYSIGNGLVGWLLNFFPYTGDGRP